MILHATTRIRSVMSLLHSSNCLFWSKWCCLPKGISGMSACRLNELDLADSIAGMEHSANPPFLFRLLANFAGKMHALLACVDSRIISIFVQSC